MVKDKIILDSIDKDLVEKKVKELFSDAEINSIDGLKLIWKDRWIHIRGSNTEPIMRIYAEASSKKEAEILVEQVKACL
jgi:phosphomannomutase